MRSRHARRRHAALMPRLRALRSRRPGARLGRAYEVFYDAREALRIVLEDEIEAGVRAVCPTATGLDVEVYSDELSELRGRLIAVNSCLDLGEEHHDALVYQLADALAALLDDWAITASAVATEIGFRPLPAHP